MNRIRSWLVATFVMVLATGPVALAQTQPADGGAPADRGGGGGGATSQMDNFRPANVLDGQRGYSDYPAAEVQVVPVARAQAARARAEFDLAQLQVHRWIDSQWDGFMSSREYRDAADAERRAYENYQRERDRVLRRLSDDSTYRAMVDLITDLRERIERERNGRNASEDEMEQTLALATLKLGYASTVSAMEAAALSADNGVQDARNRLVEAGSRVRDMRGNFARTVRTDPQFMARRENADQLRIERVVTDAFLRGAINAREIALDYAYYLHRWDQYRYSGLYGSYVYPYYDVGYGYGGTYMRRY